MKKILRLVIVCALLIAIVYYIRANNIKIDTSNFNISQITNSFNKSNFAYTKDFKINKLQISDSDYYFNQLTSDQKLIYSSLALGVSKFEKDISISNYQVKDAQTSSTDVSKSIDALFNDHPEIFYLNFNYQVNNVKSALYNKLEVQVSYTSDANTIKSQIDQIDNIIRDMTNQTTNLNDFNKELYLHDSLGKMASYYNYTDESTIPQECHTVYGPLIDKKAVCDGFTKAMQLLLDRVGIDSIFVSGTTDNKAHAWNLVKLDNEWYNMDLTSDKLIKETDGNTLNVIHSYFNITTAQILNTHTIDKSFNIPSSTATNYNYYIYTNSYIYGTNDFDTKLTEIVNLQSKNSILEFATDEISDVPKKMTSLLYNLNFNDLKKVSGSISLSYYKVLNSYIVLKK